MQNRPQVHLDFKVSPAFGSEVAVLLFSIAAPGGDPEYALACSVVGYTEALGVWEVKVPTETAEHLLADFWSISLDPEAKQVIGVDGTTYSLRLPSETETETREASWWSCYPDGWEVLHPLLRRLITLAGPRAGRHVDLRQCLKR